MGASGREFDGDVRSLLDENIDGFGIGIPGDCLSATKYEAKSLPLCRGVKNRATAGGSRAGDRQITVRVCDDDARRSRVVLTPGGWRRDRAPRRSADDARDGDTTHDG